MMEALIGSWVFLGIYGLAHVAFTWLLARWYYDKELRSAREYGDELLCKEQSKRTEVELELAKARQANVDTARAHNQLLRDKDQLNQQVDNQSLTIRALKNSDANYKERFVKLDSKVDQLGYELDLALSERDAEKRQVNKLVDERRELREQIIAYVSEIEQLNKQAIDLKIDLDRYMDVLADITLHLDDMAIEIASVTPDAKGD